MADDGLPYHSNHSVDHVITTPHSQGLGIWHAGLLEETLPYAHLVTGSLRIDWVPTISSSSAAGGSGGGGGGGVAAVKDDDDEAQEAALKFCFQREPASAEDGPTSCVACSDPRMSQVASTRQRPWLLWLCG